MAVFLSRMALMKMVFHSTIVPQNAEKCKQLFCFFVNAR